jgi:hypothetical protein
LTEVIVSRSRKFIFFHNPKVAGTSFRQAISEYHDFGRIFWGEEYSSFFQTKVDLAHLRSWELPCVTPGLFRTLDRYRSLVFLRNPERRFVSACFEHFRKFRGGESFLQLDSTRQREAIKVFLKELTVGPVLNDVRYIHFSPQKWYVFLGTERLVTHLMPVFSEADDLAAACDLLEVPRRPVRQQRRGATGRFEQIMCPEIREFVSKFYAADYEMFESFDHLRPLCDSGLSIAAASAA